MDSGCLFIVSKNYKYFYSLLPCFLIILYLYPVCYFISNRQPAVIASDDQPVAAFLDDLDGAAFFDVHVSHSFKDFRTPNIHFMVQVSPVFVCDKACIKIPPLGKNRNS